jgi:hypothetical protein
MSEQRQSAAKRLKAGEDGAPKQQNYGLQNP